MFNLFHIFIYMFCLWQYRQRHMPANLKIEVVFFFPLMTDILEPLRSLSKLLDDACCAQQWEEWRPTGWVSSLCSVLVIHFTSPLPHLFLLCLCPSTSSTLRPYLKPCQAWPGGGEQPPKDRKQPENGVSSKEKYRPEIGYSHKTWRRHTITEVTCLTCPQVEEEGR